MSLRLKFQQQCQLLALALFFVVWIQSLTASAAPGVIKITAATWSGKSVLAAAAHKVAIPANLQDPLFPLKYPSSFHAMLMDSGPNVIKEYVGYACLVAIQNHLKQKKSFFSKVMRDRFTIEVKNYPNAQVRDGKLFHHTDSQELLRIASQKTYGDLFSFARTKRESSQAGLYEWYFYVAGDPISSESYGLINMMVTVSPNTLVLENGGDMPGDNSTHEEANKLIEGELISGDPALASCKGEAYENAWYNSMLVMLAAEANGIGLISYFGIENIYGGPRASGYQWLQVVGPWAIQAMEQVQ